jgi:transcriptional regulator with XRE-family HTH domain
LTFDVHYVHIRRMEQPEIPCTKLGVWMRDNQKDDAAVAIAIGEVSRSQISRIRRGLSRPSLDLADKLSELTGVPALDLMRKVEVTAAAQGAAA